METSETSTEIRGTYSQTFVTGAKLALFKAKRVNTADHDKYPKGYYLVKAEETPAVWNSEDPVDNRKTSVTAMWITDGKPKYFEGIPVGDYILEELETPGGYIPASMEITVEETGNLQSFVLKDDHTKLEVFKLERNASGEKEPLSWPAAAEFVLCEAVLDENGGAKTENGAYLYRKDRIVDSWKADDLSEYVPAIPEAYEKMLDKAWQLGFSRLPDMKEKQNANIGTSFLSAFDAERRHQIRELLDMGKYIPQEILNEHDW